MIEAPPMPAVAPSPNPIYAGPPEPSETCRAEVVASLDDWRARLDAFFARIDEWCGRLEAELPENPRLVRYEGSILQQDEPPMRRCEVAPGMLPTRAILLGRNRLSLVPSGRFLRGARGRVNARTNLHSYAILDMGTPGAPDWRLVLSKVRMTTVPFDESAFRELVLRQMVDPA